MTTSRISFFWIKYSGCWNYFHGPVYTSKISLKYELRDNALKKTETIRCQCESLNVLNTRTWNTCSFEKIACPGGSSRITPITIISKFERILKSMGATHHWNIFEMVALPLIIKEGIYFRISNGTLYIICMYSSWNMFDN